MKERQRSSQLGAARRAAVLGLAAVGAQRLYQHGYSRLIRWHVERIERNVPYDEDMQFCLERGEPLFLTKLEHTTTLFFIDGFRIRPAVGMYGEWLHSLHEEHGVNIIAPTVGQQSLPFRLRAQPWSLHRLMREGLQLYDAYTSTLPPGHRVVVGSFSFGSLVSMGIAAKRKPAHVVIMSPLPANIRAPRPLTGRMRPPFGQMLNFVLDRALDPTHPFRLERMGWLEGVMPYYVRPTVNGGWDIADRELREKYNAEIHNGQELGLRDIFELLRAMGYQRDRLLAQITGMDFTMMWGQKDLIIEAPLTENLCDILERGGNRVRRMPFERSAHNLLLDCEADAVKQGFLDALRPASHPASDNGERSRASVR